MSRNKTGHGILTDDKGQEQPADKERAQESGHMPRQPGIPKQPDTDKDDEMQPTREKSGF